MTAIAIAVAALLAGYLAWRLPRKPALWASRAEYQRALEKQMAEEVARIIEDPEYQ